MSPIFLPQCKSLTADTKKVQLTKNCSDIIDTEHSSGDVNKMLLGSFIEEYDKDDGDELTFFESPDSQHSLSERSASPRSRDSNGVPAMGSLDQGVQSSMRGLNHSRDGSGSFSPVNR